jgi:hypothetical protein
MMMKAPRIASLISLALAGLAVAGCANDYAGIMKKKLRAVYGEDFKGYVWSSYPTDNFGLVTSYRDSKGDADFICATWGCLRQPPPADPVALLKINGYAEPGGGGKVELEDKSSSSISGSAVLPEIYKILKISADASATKDVTTSIALGRSYKRLLDRDMMQRFLRDLPADTPLKSAFSQGRLVLIVGDVVVDSMSITISVDANRNGKLAAELASALDGTVGKLLKGAKFDLTVKSADKGKYTLEIKNPVILAVLAKKQPEAGQLERKEPAPERPGMKPVSDWSDWPTTTVPHNNVVGGR